jgi:DNA-binding transcriptional LysR family regulator
MVLVARSDHALARMTELDRASLHGHIELVVRDSSARFGEAPREPWFGTAHAVHLGDFSGKRLALLAGLGFGWMPRHLIGEELARGELRQLALLEGATWTYRPALAHRAGHPLGPAGERFRALLLERCGAA